MAIVLVVIGVFILAASDWLQPNKFRKPKLNLYMGYFGGIVWLIGIVNGFFSLKIIYAILLIPASFILGKILGIQPDQ